MQEEQSPWKQEGEGTNSDQHKNLVRAETRPGSTGQGCKLVQSLWKAVWPKCMRNSKKILRCFNLMTHLEKCTLRK